jgi:hypothetical protein
VIDFGKKGKAIGMERTRRTRRTLELIVASGGHKVLGKIKEISVGQVGKN